MVTRFLERIFNPNAVISDQARLQATPPLDFPTRATIDDVTVLLRLMDAGDGPAMLRFARSLSLGDLLFLRRDITQPDQIDDWLRDIERGLATTVLAIHDSEIVGYASVTSDGLAWTRHVREMRVLVSPAMRGKRLGRLLTEQAFAIAHQQGGKKMIAQITTDQRETREIFASMGFESEARLRHQVVDRDGHLHDLEIMSLDVDAFQAQLEIALLRATQEIV